MTHTIPTDTFPYSSEIMKRKGRGFEEADDIFNYKPFGEFLQNLLNNASEPHTVAIHGAWGSGKTVFLEMWKEHMEAEGFSVIYFDAFKHDYQSNAFLSLTKALCGYFKKDDNIEKFKDKTKKVAKIFLRNLADKLSKGMVDEEAINTMFNSDEDDSTLEKFKEDLLQLIREKENNKPLIFIVDELDRCRPDFALEILEKVKHIFNISNLHFIFAINMKALENSAQKIYGVDRQYLQKFFKFSLTLPKKIINPFSDHESYFFENTISYINYFFKKMEKDSILTIEEAVVFSQPYNRVALEKKSKNESFTIRDFQRIHDYFLFSVRCFSERNERYEYFPLLKCYLLSVLNIDLFNKLRGVIYSARFDYQLAMESITKEEWSYLDYITIGKDFLNFDQNSNAKTYWDVIDNMKYLLFSESSSPPSDRN